MSRVMGLGLLFIATTVMSCLYPSLNTNTGTTNAAGGTTARDGGSAGSAGNGDAGAPNSPDGQLDVRVGGTGGSADTDSTVLERDVPTDTQLARSDTVVVDADGDTLLGPSSDVPIGEGSDSDGKAADSSIGAGGTGGMGTGGAVVTGGVLGTGGRGTGGAVVTGGVLGTGGRTGTGGTTNTGGTVGAGGTMGTGGTPSSGCVGSPPLGEACCRYYEAPSPGGCVWMTAPCGSNGPFVPC